MPADTDAALEHLEQLGARPAIAFHEGLVSAYIEAAVAAIGLAPRLDQYGNVVARVPGTDAGVPPIALVAHMDHPGFEAVERSPGALIAEARGGVPDAAFTQPVPVQLIGADGVRIPGVLAGAEGPREQRRVRVETADAHAVALPAAVVFDLPDFERRDGLVVMRAADDLAGCAAIIGALASVAAAPAPGDVYGVFTRAEEVGLVGARVMAQERSLPHDCIVVSLESSRELPGAVQGGGPVIRVGDATFTFSGAAEQVLHVARRTLLARDPDARTQRQLMSGGTCEASAFAAAGYAATGIAFPLGNYHNATAEGGVGAEYIAEDDFRWGVALVEEAVRSVAQRRTSPAWTRLAAAPDDLQARLRATRRG